ncbi:MAG: B12-binding domain-containing radical SAM protein, partial [Candidatus Omnitrophica bacterium]|nr:B12-binding domain-containing radical SAM protein [Candidatus Omnitrophota bacterium]
MMEKFRVLLVYPNLQMMGLIPSNIAILASYLKNSAIDVKVFDTTYYRITEKSTEEIRIEHMQVRPFNLKEKGVDYKATDVFEDFKAVVEEYKPNIIGITATEDTYDLGLDLISRVSARAKGIHVIVGGVHPTFSPDEVINNEIVDSICIGEGEESLLELCIKIQSKDEITSIKNLWVKRNSRLYKNDLREPVDINGLPYEDFSVFEEQRFFRPMQGKIFRMMPVCISRGCPYNCSFCAAESQRKLYMGLGCKRPYLRLKSVSNIIDELKFKIERFKLDYIFFNSETFLARKEKDLDNFADRYAKEIGLPFWCETRVETITRKRAALLKYMNCNRVSVGIEHGNENFRRKVLRKNFTNKQAIEAFDILNEHKIPVSVNNMVGFPDETRELVFDTIRLNKRLRPDSISAFYFVPYRCTMLRQYCIKKGYIQPDAKSDTPYKG